MSTISSRVPVSIVLVLLLLTGSVLAQPGEVGDLQFGADGETLSWSPEPLADRYNIYRGYLHDLAVDFYGTTLEGDVADTSYPEPTVPNTGRGFFYLVTAVDTAGDEGTMGDRLDPDGSTAERPNNSPWPGVEVAGRWEGPRNWPVVAIHSVVLHNGKVLTWAGGGTPTPSYAWDPVTDLFDNATVPTNLFCAGHSFLPDGRVMATGGTVPLFNGRSTTWIYDPTENLWEAGPGMRRGRYYPSTTTLGDGSILVFSGNDENGAVNPDVEQYDSRGQTSWNLLTGASKSMVLYPAMHLLPDGKVFHSGPEVVTETVDPSTETWEYVATSSYGRRAGNSGQFNSVMVPPGHQTIMILGGNRPGSAEATETVEIIDLSDPVPSWSYAAPMQFKRMHSNTTILPDGTLLVSGGGIDGVTTSHPAEIYDPGTGEWTVVAMMKSFRLYHSTAVLLPDGRVMQAGSNGNPTAEFYSPGYLFRGARPVIDSAPASVRYGRNFTIGTPDAGSIASVVWIRLSSSTHSKNFEQRYVSLDFTASGNSLQATAPSNENIAPPGYYLMFVVDNDDVPSEGAFIRLR